LKRLATKFPVPLLVINYNGFYNTLSAMLTVSAEGYEEFAMQL
jgi:hypothetical protein